MEYPSEKRERSGGGGFSEEIVISVLDGLLEKIREQDITEVAAAAVSTFSSLSKYLAT